MTTEIETLQRMFDEIAEREGAPRLELDEDGAAAAANIGQLAIVDDGPDAKTVGSAGRSGVGFLKRLFNTEASRKVNAEVVADFKRAMVRAYGERIAQAAFDSEIGARAFSGEKLSSSRVRRTLDLADSLRAKRLAPPPDARGISLSIGERRPTSPSRGFPRRIATPCSGRPPRSRISTTC